MVWHACSFFTNKVSFWTWEIIICRKSCLSFDSCFSNKPPQPHLHQVVVDRTPSRVERASSWTRPTTRTRKYRSHKSWAWTKRSILTSKNCVKFQASKFIQTRLYRSRTFSYSKEVTVSFLIPMATLQKSLWVKASSSFN